MARRPEQEPIGAAGWLGHERLVRRRKGLWGGGGGTDTGGGGPRRGRGTTPASANLPNLSLSLSTHTPE